MDERGLWDLFFATGLPQAYLAIRGEPQAGDGEPSRTEAAFRPEGEGPGAI